MRTVTTNFLGVGFGSVDGEHCMMAQSPYYDDLAAIKAAVAWEWARCAAIVRSRAGDPVQVIAQAIERDDPPQPEKSSTREPMDPENSKDWRDAVF